MKQVIPLNKSVITQLRVVLLVFVIFSSKLFALNVDSSVVLINCVAQSWSFNEPWKKNAAGGGSGTGFVIEGKRIMTNAHVVSDARYVEVKRIGDDRKYIAAVTYVAHDCDLAILEIIDDNEFFDIMIPLEFGDLPSVDSVVTTYGFPLGGSHLSVTRGVVSRIQQWNYSHSGSDAHLVIQTDAAINPGNSGGPVLQDGKVVGVAFQGLTQADNIGYLIPSIVVEHVLKDIEDGKLDGFGELGISYRMDLQNPMTRSLLSFPEDESGVLITQVFPNMPAFNKIKNLDILMAIDDYVIRNDGMVKLDGLEVNFAEVMERRQVGEKVKLELWRNGKPIELNLPLKRWEMNVARGRPYDVVPTFYLKGGLCFTPLSMGYLLSVGGLKKAPLPVRVIYHRSMSNEAMTKQEEFVVLSTILPSPINQGASSYKGFVLESINDEVVMKLADVKQIIDKSEGKFITFRFIGQDLPLVLNRDEVISQSDSLLQHYRVDLGERL